MDEQIEYLFKLACLDPNFTEEFAHLEEPLYIKNNRKKLAEIMGEDVIEQIEQMVEDSKILKVIYHNAIEYNMDYPLKFLENYNNGILDLRLNFNEVNSPYEFKTRLIEIINSYWVRFKKEHSTKKDTKDFKTIWEVGQLYEIEGKTFKEIAERPNCPYSERSARNYHEDYKQLGRGGGWRNYRKYFDKLGMGE
jgi:hypothetical protein